MKIFHIYIVLLLLFIFGMAYYNTYIHSKYVESFKNQEENHKQNTNAKTDIDIILLGDSILKNNSYVADGKAIDDLIKERNIGKIHSLAINNSLITDVYFQLNNIPSHLNKESTYIFLSAGGNDILKNFVENESAEEKQHILNTIFKAYKRLVKSIQTKMNNTKLILIDVYYPTNIKYSQHHNTIKSWNNMIEEFKNEKNNNIYDILNVSKLLTNESDFTFDIEPSSSGSKKIVHEMAIFFN